MTQSQTQRQKELQIELKAARDTTVSAKMIQERVDTEASRRRMSLEEELQQMKEQSRILEDKVAKAEFDCKLKEVTKGTIRRRFLISDYDHKHYLLNLLLTDMCLGYSSTARW